MIEEIKRAVIDFPRKKYTVTGIIKLAVTWYSYGENVTFGCKPKNNRKN